MPGFLVSMMSSMMCPHSGKIVPITTNNRVLVSKQPVLTVSDTFNIVGCPFTIPSGPYHPCVTARWIVTATRVLVNKKPVILQDSTGICQAADQVPQGSPMVTQTQTKVKGV